MVDVNESLYTYVATPDLLKINIIIITIVIIKINIMMYEL